jgi:formate-dependent nitrite reductase cytochrome c552 subunit
VKSNSKHATATFTAIVAVVVIAAFAGSAFAATAPVTLTVTVTGDPVPGATVTAKANVTINDGSTLTAIKWTQNSGVPATLSNTTTNTITAVLGSRKAYRELLTEILEEPPATASGLPSYIPLPDPFEAGLQNVYTVVGSAPYAIEEAAHVGFEIAVTTTSGTYKLPGAIASKLPWSPALGLQNVPLNLPVMLHGKNQATYDWKLAGPTGSTATLTDATTQNPEFTPAVAGTYTVTVTDLASAKPVTFKVIAGTWKGVIVGKDATGRPQPDFACRECHGVGTPIDMFTPWAKSGHAEILEQNVNTLSNHYGPGCVSCHSVGYAPGVSNGGFDDASDFAGLLASGILAPPGALNNYDRLLKEFPASARLANIQCENCHGPNTSEAHFNGVKSDRDSLSSDVCGTCHGEPARHGRFQQWQLSRHGNYETARAEGTNPGCTKCHSAQGFIQWESKGFSSTATITVDWTLDQVHPQTCATCHDPHAVGTTSGGPTTNATVRISGSTPMLDAGFKAENVGTAAICITCHNGRRGLKDDQHAITDLSRAPHVGPQGDVVMGYNMYFTEVGIRGQHGKIADSCVTCHMEKTKPPADLSYNYGGTNHTFYASKEICSTCHTQINGAAFQEEVEGLMEDLKAQIELALKNGMQTALRSGNFVDLGTTRVKSASEISAVEYIESHGRQGVTVTLSTGAKVSDLALNSVLVVPPAGKSVELLATMDVNVAKAGWNYWQAHSDKSKGIHNPPFVKAGLEVATFAAKTVNANYATGGATGSNAAYIGGGVGNGTGAVTCTTPYVYWAEIAGHMPGNENSQWRTDLVTRNLASGDATLKFVLHQDSGDLTGTGSVPASSQKAFEDVIATIGGTNNMGSLEICSDKPLLVRARVFNQAANGTFGQGFEGWVADRGYKAGQTVSLIGLRQLTGAYRTNIAVSNAGKAEAEVAISLFSANGSLLKTYNVKVPAGQVKQEGEPFKNVANQPDLGWGYSTVTVITGTNVHVSGSVVDMKTNDPTTIQAQQ